MKKIYILLLSAVLFVGFSQSFDEIIITDNGSIIFTDCVLIRSGSENLDFLPINEFKRLAFGTYENPFRYIWLHSEQYLRLVSNNLIDLVCLDGDIEIEAGGNISFYTDQKKESQMLMYLPAIKNGESKIECTLWYDPITKTLKAEPINKITCGGFE